MYMKKNSSLVVGIIGFFLATNIALAAEFLIAPRDGDGSLVMGSKQELKNVYALGTYVTLNGKVLGDLFALGSQVTYDGEVETDANIVGATVNLNGPVGEDLRLLTSSVNVNNKVGGDVLVASGQIVFSEKADVAGDMYIAGDTVKLNSQVKGGLKIRARQVFIDGKIDGDVYISKADEVVFGSNAQVLGKVKVSSVNSPEVKEGAVIPKIDYESWKKSGMSAGLLALFTGWFFVKLLSIGLAAWVFLKLSPSLVKDFIKNWNTNFLKNFGIGALVLVLVPVLSVFGFVSLVGMYLSVISLLLYFLLLAISHVLTGALVGGWVWMKQTQATELVYSWRSVVLGTFVVGLIGLVPVVGSLFNLTLVLFILGSIVTNIWTRIRN